ncbi:MAG: hypothetical protein WBO97_00115 [Tepidiformaceae bacterium]
MPQLKFLQPGMSVLDVNQRHIGTVASVGKASFVVNVGSSQLEIRREALFSVGRFAATLVCDRASLTSYAVASGPSDPAE